MESYHTFSFAVQVIIISLYISNDNLLDATNEIRLSKLVLKLV